MGKIKALGKSGEEQKRLKRLHNEKEAWYKKNIPLNARDQMLKICNTIWTSRQPEQIKGCEKMLTTYIKANGKDNIGVTFIQLELSRQIRLNALFAKMGQVQTALQKENAAKAATQSKVKFDKPLTTDELKAANIKRVESEQTKIMNKKIKPNGQ
tara:strand:+ start:5760 stop:6224 length:465 start_codon:yes stop_codon:yes gene_type:complete